MANGGQSRRAVSLGAGDPRARRPSGGIADFDRSVSPPVGVDDDGRLTLTGGMKAGDILRWDGGKAQWVRPWTVTSVKTSAYTCKVWEVVRCDPTSAGFTVTLPPSPSNADLIIVKNASDSTNTITVARFGQDLIDGASSVSISAARAVAWFMAIEGGWLEV